MTCVMMMMIWCNNLVRWYHTNDRLNFRIYKKLENFEMFSVELRSCHLWVKIHRAQRDSNRAGWVCRGKCVTVHRPSVSLSCTLMTTRKLYAVCIRKHLVSWTAESPCVWRSNIYRCSRWCHVVALFIFGTVTSIVTHLLILQA